MDITTNKSKKQYMFEEDQVDIGNSESQYKASLFGVLYVLLKDQGISIYTSCLLAIIQCIHLMFFAFHSLTSPMWSYLDVTDVLEDIFGYFNVVNYMKNASWNVYIAVLYVFLGIIIFVLLDIAYVNFTFSRRKSSFSWSVWALKNLLLLFTTILFLPFTNYFTSVLDCTKDYSGTYVHTYFSEIRCWNGEHIIHVCFAVVALVLYAAISLIASLTLYEYKNDQNNPSSRVSARPSFFLNVYQLVTIICLTFFSGIELQIIVLAMIVGGSTLLFTQFHFNCPYHDEILTKLWSILTALNLWTALMLVFAKVLEGILFEGSVIAWIVGLPFIAYIMYVRKDQRINFLLINVNKFKTPLEVQNQARYVMKLIEWEQADSNAGILLKGYLEIHKKSCNKDDCPLKQKGAKNTRFAKSLMNKGESVTEKYAMYIQLLYKTYADAVVKFPKSVALRISYAFFLLEKMNSRQQALQELLQAEQNKPMLDEEFIIFRYKKIIEDEIAESQNENQGGLDVVTELTFQTHLRQIQANIEKATLLYMEFWAQLTEETPDLAKLNDIGSKISASVQTVEDNWVKLLKVNPNNPVAMKLYGKFLLEIINDKEGGEDLIEKAMKLATAQANKKTANVLEGSGDDDNHDVVPTVWMSGEHENLGLITGINLAAASLFGYNKAELMNKKVNVMMPDLFSQRHDQFIENYLNTGESTIIGKNKERLVFGKHKTDYIFPAYISLKSVQSLMQGIQFIATFRIEKNFKSTAYVITDSEGVIDSMTSSCINILRIDLRAAARKANIQDYVPNIIKNRSLLFPNGRSSGKTSVNIQYTYPKDVDYSYSDEGKNSVQLNCHLTDLVFSTGKQVAGYQFRFDHIHERVVQPHEFNKNVKISNFQFRNDFEQPKASFVGEYIDHHKNSGFEGYNDDLLSDDVKSSMDPDGSFIRSDSKQVSEIWKVKPPPKQEEEEEHHEVKRINYGYGVKTYKLYHGKPVDLDESKDSSEEDSSEEVKDQNSRNPSAKQYAKKQEETSMIKEEEADADIGELGNTFKSRKQLNMVVSDRTPPTTVKNLKRTVNLLCLALIIVALVDYIMANQEFDDIERNIDYLEKANRNTAEFMNILATTRDTYLINIGLLTSTLVSIQTSMRDSLNAAKTWTQYLSSETKDLTAEHLNLLTGSSITLTSQDGTTTQRSLVQACQEIISRGFALLSKTGVTKADEDYYYINYNLLNDVYIGLRTSVLLYGEKANDKVNNDTGVFLILLIASIIILILALLVIFAILYQVNKSREEVLSLFLDIPEKTVKALFKKCETFITNLQIGEEEEVFSQVDDDDLDKTQADIKESNDSHEFIPRKKRKHFKNSGRSQKAFFSKFIILALIVEGFFLYHFIAVQQLLGDISDQLVEFNATAQAEPFYSFGTNALKQLFLDKTFPVYNIDVYSVNTLANKMMYDLDAEILQLHAINRNLHTSTYSGVFNQIMMSNPCGYITDARGIANCATFAGQSVSQGISVASTKYFEDLRVMQRCWLKIAQGSNCSIDLVTNVSIAGYNSTQNLWFGLFLTPEAREVSGMHKVYFRQTFRALVDAFQESISDEFKNHLTVKLVVFVVYLVLITIIYIVLWIPLVRKINNDIWRTKSMLSMIPLNVISKIKSVRIYLKRFWSDQNFHEM